MDVSTRTLKTVVNEDQRWIGAGGSPLSPCRSIVLKRSTLTAFEAQGYVPSGIELKYETDGRVSPYVGGVSEVQTVTVDATSFTLTWNGQTTTSMTTATTNGADVQAALEALSNIGVGDVAVTGVDTGPYTVTFRGALSDQDVAALTGTGTGGAASVVVATTTAGAVDADEVGIGYLFTTQVLPVGSTGDIGAALFWDGEVITNYLPAASTLDAQFRADVAPGGGGNARINFITHRV
jgi:hypothetical protein